MGAKAEGIENPRSGSKLGEAGYRFGDYLCVACANLPCVSGHNNFTNTQFTRHITNILKSKWESGMRIAEQGCS